MRSGERSISGILSGASGAENEDEDAAYRAARDTSRDDTEGASAIGRFGAIRLPFPAEPAAAFDHGVNWRKLGDKCPQGKVYAYETQSAVRGQVCSSLNPGSHH